MRRAGWPPSSASRSDRYATTAVSSEMPDALETDIRPFAATLPAAPVLKAAAPDQVAAVKLTVEAVMLISRRNGRVCPRPDAWLQLYELLPAKRTRGAVWQPTPPVAAPAWRACSEVSKRGVHLISVSKVTVRFPSNGAGMGR